MKRKSLFKVIGILLPFLFLFLLEITLRVFHYGNDLRLFIQDPRDENSYILNPAASRRYFSNQRNATTGNTEPFKKEKEAGTMRIFILGESTTIGYPYFHNGSFHRWLQYRLTHVYPDRKFEIINIALTAVNSYTVWGFAREVVDYQPDAVLIYTGHNEYYGALGVGSTDRIGGSSFLIDVLLKLRQLRVVQGITNLYESLLSSFHGHSAGSPRTRMEMMVGDQEIPYGSDLYNRGLEQFRRNMDKTLGLLDEKHIPVFISTVVSNEKDLFPFISLPADSVLGKDFVKDLSMGRQAYDSGDLAQASRWLGDAIHMDSSHALCNYYLGRIAFLQGDQGRSKAWLSRAKELDALRFRAPDQINFQIAELCNKYKSVHLVDARAAFEDRSPGGVVGNELLLEHVHPNLDGYGLLSDVFYRAMKNQGIFGAPPVMEMDFEELRQAMPVLKIDSLIGVYKVQKLKKSWPFKKGFIDGADPGEEHPANSGTIDTLKSNAFDSVGTGTLEEKLAYKVAYGELSWEDALDELYKEAAAGRDWKRAARIVEALTLEYPDEPANYERAGNIYGQIGDDASASFYFHRCFMLAPTFELAHKLFVLYLKMDRPSDALPYLDYAIQNNTGQMNLHPVRQIALQIIQLRLQLGKDSLNVSLLGQIAEQYMTMGNRAAATLYANKALHLEPSNKEALLILERSSSASGK